MSEIIAIQIINDDGAEEAGITVSNLKVQAGGALLKAKVSVGQQVRPGRRTVRILTAADVLPLSAASVTIEIIP